MKILLDKQLSEGSLGPFFTEITDRLPNFISSPCNLQYSFQISRHSDYYVIELIVDGDIVIICQRCLADFKYTYHNESKIAVCLKDEVAERLMTKYECIVVRNYEVDLDEIITDELHLFCPDKHSDFLDCDDKILDFFGNSL